MKKLIEFERGKSPKEVLGIGVEAMRKEHRILVIETQFNSLQEAANSLFGSPSFGIFGSDQYGRHPFEQSGSMRKLQDAYWVILANDDKFRIVKARFAPAHSEMSPANVTDFAQNWDYPKERLNDCIMWMAKETEGWQTERWRKDV